MQPECLFAEKHLAKIEWQGNVDFRGGWGATVIALRHHATIRQILPSAATPAGPRLMMRHAKHARKRNYARGVTSEAPERVGSPSSQSRTTDLSSPVPYRMSAVSTWMTLWAHPKLRQLVTGVT